MKKTIDIYTDIVCPYCLLAEHAIRDLIDEEDVSIRWHPFELRPDPVPTLRVEDPYLPDIWDRSVYPTAKRLGVPITLPTISPQPRTDKAFQIFAMAEEQGKGHEFNIAAMKAFFQQNQNIGDNDVLADVAESIGLDRDEVLAALEDGVYRATHEAAQRHAVEEAQIRSVPTIIVGNHKFTGVPRPEEFKQALRQL
ncbi:DsbA family oxidoreductase [Alteromonas sp. a30]|uniref:DsbA family oxidoreductase n=1 Tax=Alteromonas sp. a30 TaxID=2730917 RepID=UPI00227DCEB7|nr:DsbA family oxidoreductase [Alteromonas sp. a30]MCY7294988.1 DsbA family oxidoreductase [Alteromonas sp. a30]